MQLLTLMRKRVLRSLDDEPEILPPCRRVNDSSLLVSLIVLFLLVLRTGKFNRLTPPVGACASVHKWVRICWCVIACVYAVYSVIRKYWKLKNQSFTNLLRCTVNNLCQFKVQIRYEEHQHSFIIT